MAPDGGVGGHGSALAVLPLVRRPGTHCTRVGWFGGVWRKEHLLPATGLEPRNVQPSASRYTDYPIPVDNN
jgi:hypothetical protein